MANTNRLIFLLCLLPSFSLAAEPGEIDLSGWIKNTDGTYTKAFGDSKVTLTSPPQGIKTTTTATVNTSKGLVPFDISKTGNVDLNRVGKSVRQLAVLGGPLGLGLTALNLVCELTTICNQAGQWFMQQDPAYSGYPEQTGVQSFCMSAFCAQTMAPTKELACSKGSSIYATTVTYNSSTNKCVGNGVNTDLSTFGSCSTGYTRSGSVCNLNSVSHVPTSSDWDAKQSLMNDSRFIQELIDKAADVPINGVPTLTPDQKKRLGVDSEPTKDAQGNVTGRQETITEISAVDAGTSDKPGNVIIKETKTTIKYDTNNTQISTNTSTSYTNQPETVKPTGFEIKFDEIGQATISNYNVPSTFNANSWGTGTCPPDIEISLTNFTFSIPTSPICNFAEMIKPFVLMLASVLGVYITACLRGGSK